MLTQARCTTVAAGYLGRGADNLDDVSLDIYQPASQRKPPRLKPSSRLLQVLDTLRLLWLGEVSLASSFSCSM